MYFLGWQDAARSEKLKSPDSTTPTSPFTNQPLSKSPTMSKKRSSQTSTTTKTTTTTTTTTLKSRKKELQVLLHDYQKQFQETHGRPIKSAQDIEPLKKEYAEYKVISNSL